MAKDKRAKERTRIIYLQQLERPKPLRIFNQLKKEGYKVGKTSVYEWIKQNLNWEELRQRVKDKTDSKQIDKLAELNVERKVKQLSSLSDIKDALLKEFDNVEGKSKEGIAQRLIELEKALSDKTTDFTPPTSIVIRSKEYEDRIAQLSKNDKVTISSVIGTGATLPSKTETSTAENSPKTPLLELSTGKKPESEEKQSPNGQVKEGGYGGNKPAENDE